MRSQAWYNTNIQKFLTQFLIFLIDNKKASYKSFQELSDITPAAFSKYIKYFKEMIIDLKLNMTLIVEKIQETEIDTSRLKTNYYYLQYIEDNMYQFEYNHLPDEKRIRYSMTILYLMLKSHKYIKTSIMKKILPNLRTQVFKDMIEKLQEIVADEITLNEIKSYVLVDDEL